MQLLQEEVRRALSGQQELPQDWTTAAKLTRETGRRVFIIVFS